jgi:putative ABC transport system ATP-binding protein
MMPSTDAITPIADAITLESVSKSYGTGEALQHVLDEVDFAVKRGEFTVISGPSGCGKSTLLNIMGGIDFPNQGKVRINGTDINALKEHERAKLRNETLGFIFQSFHLVPVLSALENVCLPMSFYDHDKKARLEYAAHLLNQVGLGNHMRHKPGHLSGGQRQRVAIARALSCKPSIVLADEPTGNLDSKTALDIIALLRRLNDEKEVTFIFSTHDPKIVEYAKRCVHILDRKLVDVPRAAFSKGKA